MDSWLNEKEDLFLLAPIFSLAQKCEGGWETEITVCCLGSAALQISLVLFGCLPIKPINWMSRWFLKKILKLKLQCINMVISHITKIETLCKDSFQNLE